MPLVTTETFDSWLAAVASTTTAPTTSHSLAAAKFRAAAQPFNPSTTIESTEIVAPSYTGYADVAVVWGKPQRDGSGNIEVVATKVLLQMTDALAPTTIYGYALIDADGTTVLASEAFAAPQTLADALDALGVIVHFITTNQGNGTADLIR